MEQFAISGAAGELIRGYVHVPAGSGAAPVVLLAHGFKGFADYGFLPLTGARLAEAGFVVIRFSFSHCGITENPESFDRPDLFEHDTFGRQIADTLSLLAAIEDGSLPYGERMDADRIAMVGHSRGGVTAVLATGATDKLKVVVTLAAPEHVVHDQRLREMVLAEGRAPSPSGRTGEMLYIGRDVLDDIDAAGEQYNLPMLLACYDCPFMAVHCTGDETVDYRAAEHMAAAHMGGATELAVLPDGGHTFDFKHGQDGSTPVLDVMVEKVSAFLTEHLL